MNLGLDKGQIEAVKELAEKTTRDPIRFRFVASVVILCIGVLAVGIPLAERLDAARKSHREAAERAALSQGLRFLAEQIDTYTPRLSESADISDWQEYILEKLRASGAKLSSLEPKKTVAKGVFKAITIEVTAKGTYSQLVDFVDRLERGDRIVRLDRANITRLPTTLALECIVRGLVKPPRIVNKEKGSDG